MNPRNLRKPPASGKLLAVLFTFLAILGTAEPAHAACLNGKLQFWYELGNFCNTTVRNCSGYLFTQNTQNTWVGMPELKFDIVNGSGTVLGSGTTDDTGSYAACYSGSPASVTLKMYPEHQSGAFQVHTSSGGRWNFSCSMSGLGSGTSTRNCGWGGDGAPNTIASVYYTAWVGWRNSVVYMPLANSGFTNVSIRMDQTASNTAGYDKVINILNSTNAEMDFATTMHEMGHVSSIMASRDRYMGCDSSNKGSGLVYNACGGNSTWQFTSTDECGDAVYMEATAEFLGAWARQLPDTFLPCTSRAGAETECMAGGGWSMETAPSCGAARLTVQDAVRYLWDAYDPKTSPSYPDQASIAEGAFDGAFYRYPNGRGDHQKSENWCCSFWTCWPCYHDNKNMNDYNYHLSLQSGQDTSGIASTNCM